MEFYWYNIRQWRIARRFQFPTGWNSTLYEGWGDREAFGVSIPNGMEFYLATTIRDLARALSFNSQRDGILPPQAATEAKAGIGFNSQRDGILRDTYAEIFPETKLFQFPTGWNSTYRGFIFWSSRRGFQFPTGWNSTGADEPRSSGENMFQFPTGWNSTQIAS